MKDPWDALALWLTKVLLIAIAIGLAVTAIGVLWVFSQIVRIAANALVARRGSEPWPQPDEGQLRLTGAAVGACLGLGLIIAAVGLFQLPIAALPVGPLLGAVLGGVVATEGVDPWRALPVGRFVDDWRDDVHVS